MVHNMTLFEKSTRSGNDAANKQREEWLSTLLETTLPDSDVQGRFIQEELQRVLSIVALQSGVGPYTSVKLVRKGGRTFNYDFDAVYTDAVRKIEFKYGCSSIQRLPQFLSLSVKQFLPEFIPFWWEHLDRYRACDEGLTYEKPSLDEYTAVVGRISSELPFFVQMKEREGVSTQEKHKVVNECIAEFLRQLPTIPLDNIKERFRLQQDKYFLLWDKKMYVDSFTEEDMDVAFHSVTKNSIVLKSAKATFSCLLRWRNHKGILNPAWQISMKRIK